MKIRGDVRRNVGMGKIVVDGSEIDLSKSTPKDVISFQSVTIDALGDKKASLLNPKKDEQGREIDPTENLTISELSKITDFQRQWFIDYLCKYELEQGITKEDIEQFVYKNFKELRDEFTIGFGLADRDTVKEASEKK